MKECYVFLPFQPDGICPAVVSPLDLYLTPKLPGGVVIDDPSVEAVSLLRVLYGLCKHWNCLYDVSRCLIVQISRLWFVHLFDNALLIRLSFASHL